MCERAAAREEEKGDFTVEKPGGCSLAPLMKGGASRSGRVSAAPDRPALLLRSEPTHALRGLCRVPGPALRCLRALTEQQKASPAQRRLEGRTGGVAVSVGILDRTRASGPLNSGFS